VGILKKLFSAIFGFDSDELQSNGTFFDDDGYNKQGYNIMEIIIIYNIIIKMRRDNMDSKQFNTYVGCKEIQIKDESKDVIFNILVQYPTNEPSAPVTFGPYTMHVCINAKLLEGEFPLVMISHGNGGSLYISFISVHTT